MPFTPTHVLAVGPIAAILPRLPLSALAIGSMIPDLPLFLSFAPSYAVTHSLTGVVIACLPLGALVFLLFQYLLKVPMVALLPPPFTGANVVLLLPLHRTLALVLGACGSCHIDWESHAYRVGCLYA